MDTVFKFFYATVQLWEEISFYLLLGMAVSGLIHIFLGRGFIARHIGKAGIIPIIKAALLGVPLPVCSCGVIPIVSSLEKEGAHKSNLLSFLVATPVTGIDSILATYSLLGPLFAVFRPLAALFSGIALGIADYALDGKKTKNTLMPQHSHAGIKVLFQWGEFFKYSFLEIPQDIGKTLIMGTILGGIITVFIPVNIFSHYISFPLDFLIALIAGIPLYVCATGSIPVAASLLEKGFTPGAVLVFLIAGPATNTITLSFVREKFGKKSFYLYLISIIAVSALLGLVFNHLWFFLNAEKKFTVTGSEMLPVPVKVCSGIILFVLVLNALFRQKTCDINEKAELEISVPDIHCSHCRMTLEVKLRELEGVNKVIVDVAKKIIKIKGRVDKDAVLDKIKESGYHPQ